MNRKTCRVSSLILAVVFLATCCLVGALTVFHNPGRLYNSARYMVELDDYLPSQWNAMDLLNARIRSFESTFSDVLWMSTEIGYWNAGLQMRLGKQMISTGSANMVQLSSGHYYDLSQEADIRPAADEIIRFSQLVAEREIPFYVVYDHPVLYDVGSLPKGFWALDHMTDNANNYVSHLRDADISVCDSRDVLPESGFGYDQLLYYTDQHWTTLSSLIMARRIAQLLRENAGLPLNPDLLQVDVFESLRVKERFMGKYGQRLGPNQTTPDDLVLFWPVYETRITRRTMNNGTLTQVTGPFRESVIRWDEVEPIPGKTWNILGYRDYGLTEDWDEFTNPDAPDITILVFKDSYSAPTNAFLSLVAGKVVSVDLRKSQVPAQWYLDEYQPDVVIVAFSIGLLIEHEYEFFPLH